ncbi:MAG: T9SS type A sorting domain-containing protein, partial [Phaeodactylibacter sp.]|nr:T9SS type A sorting domain-containing protein [Phaeodactylibacter sp.]
VFNLQGQRVRQLESAPLDAGSHERVWDGKADGGQAMAPGVYLLRLQTQDQIMVKKMMLVR